MATGSIPQRRGGFRAVRAFASLALAIIVGLAIGFFAIPYALFMAGWL